MTTDIAGSATYMVRRVFDAPHGRRFARMVHDFLLVLREVPDQPPGALTTETIAVLRRLAEQVIAEIEQRLEGETVARSLEPVLAESVYEIRAALEAIDHWQRHYARLSA